MSQNILFKAIYCVGISIYYHLQAALLFLYLPVPKRSFQIQPYGGFASLQSIPCNAGNQGLAALFLPQPTTSKAFPGDAWSLKNFPFVPSSGQSRDC